jgi:hypothetical protein
LQQQAIANKIVGLHEFIIQLSRRIVGARMPINPRPPVRSRQIKDILYQAP